MKGYKFLILATIFLVSLMCVSAVSAADDVASDIVADTSDETVLEESIDDAVSTDSQDEENILTEDPVQSKNFTELKNLFLLEKNEIELQYDYIYNEQDDLKDGIAIYYNVTINGNGHKIDGNKMARIFHVNYDANVTFNNIYFTNGHTAEWGYGGAIWAENGTTVKAINCHFHNNAAQYGGAVVGVECKNCSFTRNDAYDGNGSAMYGGAAIKCTFLSNKPNLQFVHTDIEYCVFADSATLNVTDFRTRPSSGEKQMITLTSVNGTLNNIPVSIKITKDGADIGTYSCLSGDGWAVNLSLGFYTATFSVDADVSDVNRTISITSGTSFNDMDNIINKDYLDNSTIYLYKYYKYIADTDSGLELYNGIVINRNLTIEGNQHTINGSDLARMFHINNDAVVTFKNIDFTNGYTESGGHGGVIWAEDFTTVKAISCNFKDNKATYGGAVNFVDCEDCSFINNYALQNGGAIYNGNAIGCNFTNNSASDWGGAIYNGNATECIFEGNKADNSGAMYNGNAINCSFTGNDVTNGKGTAIYSPQLSPTLAVNCIFTSNNADKGLIVNVIADSCIFNGGDTPGEGVVVYPPELSVDNFTSTYNDDSILVVNVNSRSGIPIFDANLKVDVYTSAGAFVVTYYTTSSGGKVPLNAGSYIATFNATDYINATTQGNIVVNKDNSTIYSSAVSTVYNEEKYLVINLKDSKDRAINGANVTVTLDNAKTYTTDENGEIKINVANLVPKKYEANISFAGNDNYAESSATVNVTVDKISTKITSTAVSTIYNKNKYLVIKLTDVNGNALGGVKVKVTLASAKTYTTDKNGQIKINIAKLVPKTYNAKISFTGNAIYLASSKTVKVTVKKAAVKMTAKKKTFKRKVKVKKYRIILKNNVKKAIKGVKVTLKVNKKTYKAKTNKYGKAVFKIKNLKKKGTYKAVIKFAGNKYYNKVTKKVKIKVKK